MTFAILAVGIVGTVTGYGFADAIMYVAIPMMGGTAVADFVAFGHIAGDSAAAYASAQ